MPYELIYLDSFTDSIGAFNKKDRKKLLKKVQEILSFNPYRYKMLVSPFTMNGVKFIGLHKMKSGLSGSKGGAYTLYRICEECKKNGYNIKGKVFCKFCDDDKGKHVVLFISRRRGIDY